MRVTKCASVSLLVLTCLSCVTLARHAAAASSNLCRALSFVPDVFFYLKYCSLQDDPTITVPLQSFVPSDKSTHLRKQYVTLTDKISTIQITDVPITVGFYVIQVHTFSVSAMLGNNADFTGGNNVNGTNIGLVQIVESWPLPKTFYVKAFTRHKTKALLVLTIYDQESPIPGGCNLTFETEIAPYQKVSYTENLIKVEAQAPSVLGLGCEKLIPPYKIYHMYLPESDLSESSYFLGIESMITADDIVANGSLVPLSKGKMSLRKYYNAYKGTGSIFAIVTYLGNATAAYVPAMSYGCDYFDNESCYSPVTIEWKILMAVILFIGLFFCFAGHYYFKSGLFCMGFLIALIIVYMLRTALFGTFDNRLYITAYEVCAFAIAAIFGTFWVLIWEKCGNPLITILLNITIVGFFVASTLFYFPLGDISIFQNDINFWATFSCIILITSILLLSCTLHANIFVCSFLGSTAIILSLDHYVGSNLRYIIINTIRRATVVHFDEAVIDPPYQWRDTALTVLWVALFCIGVPVQFILQNRRPPFPPPEPRREQATERTPLLIPSAPVLYDYNIFVNA